MQQLALETPFEGVPTHLWMPLWVYIEAAFRQDPTLLTAAGIELRLELPPTDVNGQVYGKLRVLKDKCTSDVGLFLDLVEYVLAAKPARAARIDDLLTKANSAYKVREDKRALEMRIAPAVQAQVQEVVSTSGAAGDHLTRAWNAAYSLSPNPVESYSASVKAVETALVGRISPANTKATLGTMIADLKNKPEKWKFIIPDASHAKGVETIIGMMQVLWQRHARHGGPTHQPETLEEAQAAVHLAATLVQYGVSGAFDLAVASHANSSTQV